MSAQTRTAFQIIKNTKLTIGRLAIEQAVHVVLRRSPLGVKRLISHQLLNVLQLQNAVCVLGQNVHGNWVFAVVLVRRLSRRPLGDLQRIHGDGSVSRAIEWIEQLVVDMHNVLKRAIVEDDNGCFDFSEIQRLAGQATTPPARNAEPCCGTPFLACEVPRRIVNEAWAKVRGRRGDRAVDHGCSPPTQTLHRRVAAEEQKEKHRPRQLPRAAFFPFLSVMLALGQAKKTKRE